MPETTAIPVRLGERTYEVAIGHGLLSRTADRLGDALGVMPARALLVVDTGASPHAERVAESCERAGIDVHRLDIAPTEREKNLETFSRVLTAAARAGMERSHPIIAVGGGIVGDIAGFAASAYRRGVPSVLCPTTLLSMVDASVGGKTGVNLVDREDRLLKNMAGSFHQPSLVLADLESLSTLPSRQRSSGLAECVKHAMLAADHDDPDALSWLESNAERLLDLEHAAVADLVVRSVRLKARVVERDEREMDASPGGGRAALNLGHTFAHAMETIGHLSPTGDESEAPLQHGEAVSLGLVAACAASASMGLCEAGYSRSIGGLLRRLGLPTRVAGLPDDDELVDRMRSDKKVSRGSIRLILPTGPGRARLFEDSPHSAIIAGWSAIRG